MSPDKFKYPQDSLKPIEGAERGLRKHLDLKGEFILALFPTITIIVVFLFIEVLTEQRLLFASLASSAFLIYLDPQHGTNSVKTLTLSQMMASLIGLTTFLIFGGGYFSGGAAMVATIVLMIFFDVVHPPAVSTSISFALRAGDASNLVLFILAVGITAILVVLERAALWFLTSYVKKYKSLHKYD